MTRPREHEEQIQSLRSRVEDVLGRWLPAPEIHPPRLHEAMRYAVLGGGKRVRPVLVYATGQALGIPFARLDGPAAAVELIHAYSLIHDDLPAMDDDDLRRGKPTCHRAFDEATAILAGDAIQALAFFVLASDATMVADAPVRLRMVAMLAQSAGSRGMVGGQAIDLASTGKELDVVELENMHIHKTGALIRASVSLAALSEPDLDNRTLDSLDRYAKCLGLAFQIRDDILDVEGETAVLGKMQGADLALNKPTYPSLVGLDAAKQQALELHQEALSSIANLDERADLLRWIADYVVSRLH